MKLLFGLIIGTTIVVMVVALYCALIIAGRSDDDSKENDRKGTGNRMSLEKQICPRCKTGKYTYDLDPKSDVCPYIECWKRNKCPFYKPLSKDDKTCLFVKEQKVSIKKDIPRSVAVK